MKDTSKLMVAIAEGLAEAFSSRGKFILTPSSCSHDNVYYIRPTRGTIHITRSYRDHNIVSSIDLWFFGHNLFYYTVDSADKIAHELADPEFFTKLAKGVEEWHKSWETMNLQNTSARA